MSGVFEVFNNLPSHFPEKIQTTLSTFVTNESKNVAIHYQGVNIPDQVPQYCHLPLGLRFAYQEKNWYIQISNSSNRSCICMSNEDTVYAWLYDKNNQTKNSSLLRHCEIISSPIRKEASELPEQYHFIAAYPSHNDFFMQVITKGECLGRGQASRIPHEIHQFATQWFKKNKLPLFLLPLSHSFTVADPKFDEMLQGVDGEMFKKCFLYIGYIGIGYCIYRIVSLLLFKSKKLLPSLPLQTTLAEIALKA